MSATAEKLIEELIEVVQVVKPIPPSAEDKAKLGVHFSGYRTVWLCKVSPAGSKIFLVDGDSRKYGDTAGVVIVGGTHAPDINAVIYFPFVLEADDLQLLANRIATDGKVGRTFKRGRSLETIQRILQFDGAVR